MIINSVVTEVVISTTPRQLAEAAGVEVAEIGQQQIEDITVSSTAYGNIYRKEM